jgi:hypothetical protein
MEELTRQLSGGKKLYCQVASCEWMHNGVPAFLLPLGIFLLFTEVKYCPFTFYIGHIGGFTFHHFSILYQIILFRIYSSYLSIIPRAKGIPRYLVLRVSIGVIIIF